MTMILSPFSTRNQLPLSMAKSHPNGIGVEIGVHRGLYAEVLARNWPGGTIHGVDHWSIPSRYEYQATFLDKAELPRSEHENEARNRCRLFGNQVTLWKTDSIAASQALDCLVDFVYLDGDHERPGIDHDIIAWWHKLSPNGVLAGHDFVCPGEDGLWGKHIQGAVLEFAAANLLDVFLIPEENNDPWSWYLCKGTRMVGV